MRTATIDEIRKLARRQHAAKLRWISEAASPAWETHYCGCSCHGALDKTEPTSPARAVGSSVYLDGARNDVEHNGSK